MLFFYDQRWNKTDHISLSLNNQKSFFNCLFIYFCKRFCNLDSLHQTFSFSFDNTVQLIHKLIQFFCQIWSNLIYMSYNIFTFKNLDHCLYCISHAF